MKRIGIYGGSFNPIHYGHVGLAKWVLENTELDEVWFMVSPNNPLKDPKILAPEEERLAGVKEAIKDIPGLVASDFEFSLPKPSYMAKTLYQLSLKYNDFNNKPPYEFVLIIGEDSLKDFEKWYCFDYILNAFRVFVYPRKVDFNSQAIITDLHNYMNEQWYRQPLEIRYLYGAPQFDISSTQIRKEQGRL